MQGYVDTRKFAGCSVLIAQDGQEVWYGQAGLRRVEEGTPWSRDTVVRIYSMTKPVTTVALMMLVERGLTHLDAPVSEFIPAFAAMQALVPDANSPEDTRPCATPTLHQLLTHTSGLTYPFNPGPLAEALTQAQMMFAGSSAALADECDRLAAFPLAFPPGKKWEYSVGIDVIGRVVEVISGQPLDAFLAAHIFGPLAMTDTGFTIRDDRLDRFANLYTPLPGNAMGLNAAKGGDTLRCADAAQTSPFRATTCLSGGGGLVSTLDDYLCFIEMLRGKGTYKGERLLGAKTVDFMWRNHLAGDIASMGPSSFAEQPMEGVGFGLGGAVMLNPGRARTPGSVGDFSWGGIGSTFFWIDPFHALSVLLFTQLAPSSSYPARPQLKALVHGALY
ncbi:MAG: beta-lactamase family protein [Rhodobacteraceae bacterium]|nr:beta-lactamase family protein [Paracoccaceae bacterium]